MANGQEPKGADPTNHATPHAQPASGQAPIHRHVGGWVVLALGLLLLGLVQGVLRPRGQASGLDASEISLSINLNTATVAELCCIPHVGPKLAERIVAYREANGPFRSLADLDSVPGVGASLLEEISQAIEPLPGDQSPMTLWPSPSAATR